MFKAVGPTKLANFAFCNYVEWRFDHFSVGGDLGPTNIPAALGIGDEREDGKKGSGFNV